MTWFGICIFVYVVEVYMCKLFPGKRDDVKQVNKDEISLSCLVVKLGYLITLWAWVYQLLA